MIRAVCLLVLVIGVASSSASCGGGGGSAVESGVAANGLIAFAHGSGGLADISVINPNGSGREVLVATDEDELWPAWSPDGTKIAYTTDESGIDRESMAVFSHGDIVVMNADGSGAISITERYDGVPDPDEESAELLKSDDWDPTWSPDGEEIAYMGVIAPDTFETSDEFSDIYVVKADGSARRNLTNTKSVMEVAPEWSPDGSRIAFISLSVKGKLSVSLSVISTGGSDRRDLTKITWFPLRGTNGSLSWIYGLSWSPDGRKIAFADSAQSGDWLGKTHVFVINADGSDRQNITDDHPGASLNPAWSPDGRKIAFVTDRDRDEALYVMDADGSDPYRVTGSDTRLGFPDWQPIP